MLPMSVYTIVQIHPTLDRSAVPAYKSDILRYARAPHAGRVWYVPVLVLTIPSLPWRAALAPGRASRVEGGNP